MNYRCTAEMLWPKMLAATAHLARLVIPVVINLRQISLPLRSGTSWVRYGT